MERIVGQQILGQKFITYPGKLICYNGSIIRIHGDSDKLVYNVYGDGCVMYYKRGVLVRTIFPNGEEEVT